MAYVTQVGRPHYPGLGVVYNPQEDGRACIDLLISPLRTLHLLFCSCAVTEFMALLDLGWEFVDYEPTLPRESSVLHSRNRESNGTGVRRPRQPRRLTWHVGDGTCHDCRLRE